MPLTQKLYKFLFGELDTYEDDPFYWLADWATMLFRTPLQRYTSGTVFYFYNGALFSLAVYIYLTKPSMSLLGEYLATASLIVYFQISYGALMRNFQSLCEIILLLKNLNLTDTRPATRCLKEKTKRFSINFKKITISCIFLGISFYLGTFLTLVNVENNWIFKLIKIVSLNRPAFQILVFGFFMPHAGIFGFAPLYVSSYFTMSIKYNLEMLYTEMKKLVEKEIKHQNITDYIECLECQGYIRKEMIYFLKQFIRIKKVSKYYNNFMKWRFFFLTTGGAAILGTELVFIVTTRTVETIPYYGNLSIALFVVIVVAEIGERVESQCEKIYIAAQNFDWYNWNRSNRQLLLMFLAQTKEPIHFNCHGFMTQNRYMLLTICRMMHGYITYYQSMNGRS